MRTFGESNEQRGGMERREEEKREGKEEEQEAETERVFLSLTMRALFFFCFPLTKKKPSNQPG